MAYSFIPLSAAKLCPDCESLHAEMRCPKCGGRASEYISRWLDREEKPARNFELFIDNGYLKNDGGPDPPGEPLMPNEIVLQEQREINPLLILQQAVDKGVDVSTLEKLMDMAERYQANAARNAFNVAFSDFKAEAVAIIKRTEVKAGPLSGTKYANLFDVVAVVTPALSKHGLSHSWKLTKDEKEWMEVTCTIRHSLGYAESVSMGSSPDSGPGRNSIQARGSAKSYLERYTLLAATGMAASDQDNDGAGAPGISEDAVQERVAIIERAQTLDALKAAYAEAYRVAQKAGDKRAMAAYIDAKNRRRAEMEGAA